MEPSELEQNFDPTLRIYELTTLYEVSRVLLGSTSPEHLAFDVLTAAMGLTGSIWGVLWVATDDEGTFNCLRTCGQPMSSPEPVSLPYDWAMSLAERSQPLLWEETTAKGTTGQTLFTSPAPQWLETLEPELILPLTERGRLLGLIGLGPNSLDQRYEPFLLNLLGSVGHLVALALNKYISDGVYSGLKPTLSSLDAYRQQYPILGEIVGESQAVLTLYKDLISVAHASCTVLLEGETGSGKELAARVLHNLGPRRDRPFIEMDCGSIPENLIESELFGHIKGSFTGATQDRRGVFELASSGTLFLDEVSNLPLLTQARLLRVLQERRFRPIGGEQSLEVDVRVIAATNKDLQREVQKGNFREDLLYRLHVYPIRLPSLRERKEDIAVLAAHFLELSAQENRMPVPTMTKDFLEWLERRKYPGNVRELQHLMEQALLRSIGKENLYLEELEDALTHYPLAPEVKEEDLATGPQTEVEHAAYPGKAGEARGAWVLDMLRRHRFNVKATAEKLSSQAHTDPSHPPPLTDRSSLTYYLQGECFRLFLDHGGDYDRASQELAGDLPETARTAGSRIRKYVGAAAGAMEGYSNMEQAREMLGRKFSKLPDDYKEVLDRLARYLWDIKRSGASQL